MASTKPNPEANPVWSSWPGVTKTASQLGIRRAAMAQHILDGELEEVTAADGSLRYAPESIEQLSKSLRAMAQNETRGESSADVVKAAVDLLKQEQDHIERLLNLMIDGFERSTKVLAQSNQQLSEENSRLAAVHLDAIRTKETALSESAERDIALEASKATSSRRQQMLDALLPTLPKFIGEAGQAIVGAFCSSEAALMASFTDDQLEALLESGFLSDQQKTILQNYLANRKAKHNGEQEGNQEGSNQATQEGQAQGNQEGSNQATQKSQAAQGGQEGREEKQHQEGFQESQ